MLDAIETPLPAKMRKHWWWRPGWQAGRHIYACHLTLDDQPQLRELAAEYQQAIRGLQGLDLIPPQWLHLTMQGIGFTGEIRPGEVDHLHDALNHELAKVAPPSVDFRYLTVHPEAIYLKAHPADALYPLREHMHRAVASALGPERLTEPMPDRERFTPHVSIAYVIADNDPEPIASALRKLATRSVSVTFAKASLLEFHRGQRMYEWISAMAIPIGSKHDQPAS
jgi:2'-5' RNA ligase